ncbi:MAG TPA: 16S rRNA (uracil(1498)-N(3))-methyltransferase [Chryseosolibacter sp.]|nr:16S rRNA (uracil(1498)-N(3))-methyltransferase [Chryseosolibacter sp.]
MNIFYQPRIPEGHLSLDADESRHCVKVLRKRPGDIIHLTDGKGSFYQARITGDDIHACRFSIIEKTQEPARSYEIHIAIAPTKNPDRTEWFVEKAVEFGIDSITFMKCENSERSNIKMERIEKIAISAMKQSLRASVPLIRDLTPLDAVVTGARETQKFIAFVDEGNTRHLKEAASASASYLVLIGPEGDFSRSEIARCLSAGFVNVSLGHSRLRTETAGLAACHILNLINA